MSLRPDIAPPRSTDETEYRVIGRPISHHDFREKVRGSLAYADDWNMPGMLYGRIVRAQVPSARIRSIDIAEASRIVGVRAVLTAADVPHNVVSEEASGLGIDPIAMPVLAGERIRYQGEPVALVAAETPEIAEEAAERVWVDAEELPGVFDPEEALRPDAPLVHEQGNALVVWTIGRGDAEQAMARAPVVVEGTYRTQHVDHAYLEPEAGLGWVDGDGVLTLRVSTQVIEHAREVARIV